MLMKTTNILIVLVILLGDFRIAVCMYEEVPVCSFKGNENKCSKKTKLDCKMPGKIDGKISITNVQFENGKRQCKKHGQKCELCCKTLTDVHSEMLESVRDTCYNNTSCDIPQVAGYNNTQKYSIHYRCILPSTTSMRTSSKSTFTSTHSTSSIATTPPYTTPKTSITNISTPTSNVTKTASFTTLSTPNATPITSYTTTTTTPKSENPSTTTTMMLTSTTNINGQPSSQTRSNGFPTVSVAAPASIVVILAIVILAVICIVKRRQRKKDGIYRNDDQNNSNNFKSVSNLAYTSDGLANKSPRSLKSVERTESSFSQDSGYAECKDVDTVDDNNGEYNTINFTQSSQNIDPAYSHIQTQDKMVDSTYSHIASDLNAQNTASNYSHMDMKTRQSNKTSNSSTYNTLQTHAVNKPPQRLPANDEESENEYNHANFSTESSNQDDNDTEYSHLNSSNNGIIRTSPTQPNPSPNDTEYAEVVENKTKHDINVDNNHAYFVLEKDDVSGAVKEPCDGSDNNAHTYFVLEKDKANTKSIAESEVESTPHDYFVLTKQ